MKTAVTARSEEGAAGGLDDDGTDAKDLLAQMDRFYLETDEIYRQGARKAGLSDSAFGILYSLMLDDGLTQKQLCERSFTAKQTVSSSVRRLAERGLAMPEEGSERNAPIWLTAAGRAVVEARVQPAYLAELRAAEALNASERTTLARLLKRYTTALRTEFGAL
ncbi:MarR family winged helix-turn-helix transcriptional regulator [Enterorhabdus sp. P55]|uniref:MarR family winged helix-turn-helix transcriptional regulator n=1 Tax=Enterorhabdus sp. P55 TaxID=2304571 RepID=UPI0013691523|nr:helix-turn-helix domain-containing protein [Enterorhabdus sp. P55]NBI33026.1 MarR family transcriptional regulator [Enterorhabdus sp. P55]